MFDPEANLDLDQLRGRLAKTDVELRSFGESAAYMCSPEANLDDQYVVAKRFTLAGSKG